MGVIRIGRFDNFSGRNTLLLETNQNGLVSLIDSIERVQRMSVPVALHELPEALSYGGVQCTAELHAEDRGLVEREVAAFTWRRSRTGWLDVVAKLRSLQGLHSPAHQYLDGPTDDLQVVLAVDEYGERWWKSQAG
ncbi:MAG TPA: hypothetical protein VGK30_05620 [Candidatus Binatia bacterium]|jgi:hypothetical protein